MVERLPDHPGACHFCIHAVEAAYPERAVPGLADALKAQGKVSEAAEVRARFQEAWKTADVQIASSRF